MRAEIARLHPADPVWQVFQERLAAVGLTAAQVQVAWTELGLKFPATIGPFPEHAQVFQADLEQTIRNLKVVCPNLRILYISTRERAYTDNPTALSPEPHSYETALG